MVFAQYSFLQPINIYSFLIHRMNSLPFDRYLNADNLEFNLRAKTGPNFQPENPKFQPENRKFQPRTCYPRAETRRYGGFQSDSSTREAETCGFQAETCGFLDQ